MIQSDIRGQVQTAYFSTCRFTQAGCRRRNLCPGCLRRCGTQQCGAFFTACQQPVPVSAHTGNSVLPTHPRPFQVCQACLAVVKARMDVCLPRLSGPLLPPSVTLRAHRLHQQSPTTGSVHVKRRSSPLLIELSICLQRA